MSTRSGIRVVVVIGGLFLTAGAREKERTTLPQALARLRAENVFGKES